ncbi:3965_t:CDS:2 [Ambispora gerdemannii]|uniref:3965_t:CDS:1 n=1 Tax=Ambispora gerdemannii TaxID=144530 RepID=A0A9N9FJR6_9GLOM|nr:3965_t:CDS:2 [Ambispora gerdemannii]
MATIPQKIATTALKSVISKTIKSHHHNNSDVSQTELANSRPNNTTSVPNAINKGRKKNKYNLPPGLTKQEAKILKSVRRRARFYDENFCSCGCFSIGLDPLLGLLPVIGDFMGTFLSLMLVKTARQADLPTIIVSKMMVNVCIDFMMGLIPLLGDLADYVYKCNTRNADILHEYLEDRAKNRSLVLEEGSVEILERLPQIPEEGTSNNGKIER